MNFSVEPVIGVGSLKEVAFPFSTDFPEACTLLGDWEPELETRVIQNDYASTNTVFVHRIS